MVQFNTFSYKYSGFEASTHNTHRQTLANATLTVAALSLTNIALRSVQVSTMHQVDAPQLEG